MMSTNTCTANGMAVVRGPSLREMLVRRLGVSTARAIADEPAGIAFAPQPLDEVNGPELLPCDPGATPARWVRLV